MPNKNIGIITTFAAKSLTHYKKH